MNDHDTQDKVREAIDQAKRVTDTYSEVFMLIQQQAAERAAATVEQARREHEQELARIRLEAAAAQLAYAAATFDRMCKAVAMAPAALRPGLLGLARRAAEDLVRESIQAGGEEQAVRGMLEGHVLALAEPEGQPTHKRQGKRFVPVNGVS